MLDNGMQAEVLSEDKPADRGYDFVDLVTTQAAYPEVVAVPY